jgi:hypothetical protein
VARKPEEWYDAAARPTGPWDPVLCARQQEQRLANQYMILHAYLQMPNAANRPKAMRWRELNKMLIGLWVRMTGDDPAALIGSTEEILEQHTKTAADLELTWWATQVVAETSEAGVTAVTAAMDSRLKKISNQMAFYFGREIEELERMFGLSA